MLLCAVHIALVMCVLWYPSQSVTAAIIIQLSPQSGMTKAIWSNETVRPIVTETLIDFIYMQRSSMPL